MNPILLVIVGLSVMCYVFYFWLLWSARARAAKASVEFDLESFQNIISINYIRLMAVQNTIFGILFALHLYVPNSIIVMGAFSATAVFVRYRFMKKAGCVKLLEDLFFFSCNSLGLTFLLFFDKG